MRLSTKHFSRLLLAVSTLFMASTTFADTSCRGNPDAGVICILGDGPKVPSGYTGFLGQVNFDGVVTSPPLCILSQSLSVAANDRDISARIGSGAFKIGQNTVTIYQCGSNDCLAKRVVATYTYELTEPKPGKYKASPPVYYFEFGLGVPCNGPVDFKI